MASHLFSRSRSSFAAPAALTPCALAAALLACHVGSAQAQTQPAAPSTTEVITVTGRAPQAPASVAGFGPIPLSQSPFQASTSQPGQWQDAGVETLNQSTRLDASVSDAYNATGYWASMSVRGYALDNRFNYRRDGLPINGETALLLDNKERLEVLKGTSGAQAGTSAPGGLVNLVVKRPRGTEQRSVSLGWSEAGNLKAAADIDQPLTEDGRAAIRINASLERLDPGYRDAQGHSHLLAAAGQLKAGPDTLIEAEVELSHQAQPSLPGFSLLGDRLPSARSINPRTNLNNQPWSQPVVFDGATASLRLTQILNVDWRMVGQALSQRLRTDDHLAFPYGCSSENAYDRYCSDGSMDLYDFRSEGEHRFSRALALSLEGRADTAGLQHQLSTGLSWSDYRARLGAQTYNWAGIGRIDGSAVVPAAPDALYDNTNRTERSLEWHLRDAVSLGADARLWIGLRHTVLHRESETNTGATLMPPYGQAFTTPWVALSQSWTPVLTGYLSWGQGVESAVAPNLPAYTNQGQALPAVRSRQMEVGVKFDDLRDLTASLTLFDIQRPETADQGLCDGSATSCTRVIDGHAHHQGLEASGDWRLGLLTLRGSSLWLKARQEGSADAGLNGLVPANVPQRSLRASATVQVPQLSGLALIASVSHEGARPVLPDNSIGIPGWTSWALSTRYQTQLAGHALTWRLGVDNLLDQRAWQESPYQYGHAYLYPLAPRTFRTSLQIFL